MFHTATFGLAVLGTGVNTQIPAISDGSLSIRNGNFFLPQNMRLLYAYFGSADAVRARLVTPTWRVIANPQIRPVSSAILPPSPSVVADYRSHPLAVPAEQELSMEGTDGTGTTVAVGVMGLQVTQTPAPSRDIYTIRATGTAAAVARVWTDIPLTFDEELPPGTYHLLGMTYIAVNAVAARAILTGQFYRPGCVGNAVVDVVPDPMFRMGRLGSWGTFDNVIRPRIEVFNNGTDAVHTFFLDVAKL